MSSTQQTLNQLRELRLSGMAEAFDQQLRFPKNAELSFQDRVAIMVDHEVNLRENTRQKRLLQRAGFHETASLADLDCRLDRGIDRAFLSALETCDWITKRLNLLIMGPTGVGKSWLASAMGAEACKLGLAVLFYPVSDLYEDIARALVDGTLPALKAKLIKPALLIIDDFGQGQMLASIAQVLLDVVDRRMRSGSLMITSQYATSDWHSIFPDPTTADAVLDRVVHQAYRLNLRGESMRVFEARKRMGQLPLPGVVT